MINEKLCATYQSAFLEPVLSHKLECLERGGSKKGMQSGLIVLPYQVLLDFTCRPKTEGRFLKI